MAAEVDRDVFSSVGASKSHSVNGDDTLGMEGARLGSSGAACAVDGRTVYAEDLRELRHRTNTALASIGAEVRAMRRSMNLNITEFSDKVGLSVGMISRIENGKVSPSIETLVSMAQKLGVSFLSFFEGLQEARSCSFIPSGQGIRVTGEYSPEHAFHQMKGQWASDLGLIELHLVSLARNLAPSFTRHGGLAVLYALTGKFRYRHGIRNFVLQSGDALYFDANCLHGPELVEEYPASYLTMRLSSTLKAQRTSRRRT